MIVIFITVPKKEAKKMASIIVDKKICACVNIISPVDSLFLWNNKIDTAEESLLIAKTADNLFKKVEKEVRKIHPYDVPEIVSFKLNNVSSPYQDWVNKELSK